MAALEAGQPPDFAFGLLQDYIAINGQSTTGSWTSRTIGHFPTCLIQIRSPG